MAGHNEGVSAAPTTLVERVSSEATRLAPDARKLVVAVSGGADSVAALRLLHAAGRDLIAAHFDHRLRPESGADAEFVRALCAELGVEFKTEGADVASVARSRGWNLEDAARRLRYAFLHRVLTAEAADAIVVAHTLDDQAETVLLQLLRGTAFPTGMQARRGAVVRPLLGERRDELRDYLRELGQAWREDASNRDPTLNRAWLRVELIPRLEERFQGAQERLAATARQQQDVRAALIELAKRRFPRDVIRVAALRSAPAALRRTALAQRLASAGAPQGARLLAELDEAAMRAAASGPASGPSASPWSASLPRGVVATIANGELRIGKSEAEGAAAPEPLAVTSAEELPRGVRPSLLEEHEGLVLRGRQPGDRIRLSGGSKLLSDLLIDRKVPRAQRDGLRVLAAGAEVFWVEGVATAAGAAEPGVETEPSDPDPSFMGAALEQARLAAAAGEVPVGAVVVLGGKVVAAAHNRTETDADPTAHAELLALRAAAEASGDWRLSGATLYVTLEPCPMCLGAVLRTQLARVVFGADNLRDGALGGVTDLSGEGWKRVPEVRGGVRAAEAAGLLTEAFAARRGGG